MSFVWDAISARKVELNSTVLVLNKIAGVIPQMVLGHSLGSFGTKIFVWKLAQSEKKRVSKIECRQAEDTSESLASKYFFVEGGGHKTMHPKWGGG